MRNTQEYPVTEEEMIKCLNDLIADFEYHEEHGLACGDMYLLILEKIKEIVENA